MSAHSCPRTWPHVIALLAVPAVLLAGNTGLAQDPPAPGQDVPAKSPKDAPPKPPKDAPAKEEEAPDDMPDTPGEEPQEVKSGSIAASDAGAAPVTRHTLAKNLRYGLKLELNSAYEHNYDVDDSTDDGWAIVEPRLSLALDYRPFEKLRFFGNLRIAQEFNVYEGADQDREEPDAELELRDAYMLLKEFVPELSLQVGRQRFTDTRRWVFDERLDAARMTWRHDNWRVEGAAGKVGLVDNDYFDPEDSDEETMYYSLRASYVTKKRTFAAYALLTQDQSDDHEEPMFLGAHSHGEIINDLEYWLEMATVRGKDGDLRLNGFGADLGLTYEFDLGWKPSITAAYAFGSGDSNPNDTVDESFRQSGIQGNNGKFNGVTRFQYYGEVLDPELSNMSIYTLGLGVRPTKRFSIDLVGHYYRQDQSARRLRDTDLSRTALMDTARGNLEIGYEADLIVGYREVKDLDIELTLGWFAPGRGVQDDRNDPAFLAALRIRYNY